MTRLRNFCILVFYLLAISHSAVLAANDVKKSVVLQLSWDHQFQFAGYYAAKWKGFYSEAGFDVEIRSRFSSGGNSSLAVDEVASGRAEYGIGSANILLARDKDQALVLLASIYQQSPVGFYARRTLNLASPADLVGKKVAVTKSGMAYAELMAMLEAESVDVTKINIVGPKGGLRILQGNGADVAVGFSINANWIAKQLGLVLTRLSAAAYGVDFYGDSLFTSEKNIESDPAAVSRFIEASIKGWKYALEHPDEIVEIIAHELPHHFKIDAKNEFNRFQVDAVRRLTLYPFVPLGQVNIDRWEKMHSALHRSGQVKGSFDSNTFLFNPIKRNAAKTDFIFNILSFALIAVTILAASIFIWTRSLRSQAEAEMEKSKKLLLTVIDWAPAAFSLKDIDGKFLVVNETFASWMKTKPEKLLGQSVHDFYPDEQALAIQNADDKIAATGVAQYNEIEVTFADGNTRSLTNQKSPILSTDGSIEAILTISLDVTELRILEKKFDQSQRMEAVGQLTGGVAHDFNNLLAVMIGNAEILLLKNKLTDNSQQYINEIIDAVDRASSLTDRLLAFSRQQTLSPVASDVTDHIVHLEDMLRRSLGATIDFNFVHTRDLWPATIDPHQFENALVNLTLNARDAMSEGGKLTVETANVTLDETYAEQHEELQPGDYVEVAVTDTGIGMAPDVLKKVFEPFFTTKEVGQGSGLGLSMVFGFAKQSNGHLTIYSEEGDGTTVKLYMPRSTDEAINLGAAENRQIVSLGSERILVVEDDASVRSISVGILSEQGYDVVAAVDGNEAIELLKGDATFDLLFTDVVLPGGMNGVEIAKQAKNLKPNIKVLYTTGYTENLIVGGGNLDLGFALVNKPYRRAELLEKVRNVLDGESD